MTWRNLLALLAGIAVSACFQASKPSNELESLSKEVLESKNHTGIEIQITPIEEKKTNQ